MLNGRDFTVDSLGDHLLFFLGEGEAIGITQENGFGIDAGAFSGMERGEDNAGIFAIEEHDAEALIAPDFLERVETNHADLMKTFQAEFSQAIGNLKEFLNFLIELTHFRKLFDQHFFQVFAIFSREEKPELGAETVTFHEEKDHQTKEKDLTNEKRKNDTLEERGRKFPEVRKHGI